MKPPVLIIRTVSIEKLSPLLDVCRQQWPEHPLFIATNPGREDELRTDRRISNVVSCPGNGDGFSAPIPLEQELEAVVIPVANARGSGYANALRACRLLRTESYALAFHGSEIHAVGRLAWEFRWRTESWLELMSGWIAKLWARRLLRRIGAR